MNTHPSLSSYFSRKPTFLPALGFLGISLLSSGCSVLFGNIRSVDEKSGDYGFLDLHRVDADWVRISESQEGSPQPELESSSHASTLAKDTETELEAQDISDVSFQSSKTASIISLTSTCRAKNQEPISPEAEQARLKAYMQQLLMGFSRIDQRDEHTVELAGQPGLESTILGIMNGKPMQIRAVVTQVRGCVYDFLLIARPEHFRTQEAQFKKFVAEFKVKSG